MEQCEVSIQYFVKTLSKTFLSKKRIITESYNICRVTAYTGQDNLSTFTSMTKHDSPTVKQQYKPGYIICTTYHLPPNWQGRSKGNKVKVTIWWVKSQLVIVYENPRHVFFIIVGWPGRAQVRRERVSCIGDKCSLPRPSEMTGPDSWRRAGDLINSNHLQSASSPAWPV